MAVTTFRRHASVTASDSTVFDEESAIYVGTTGNIALRLIGDSTTVTYVAVPAGTWMPVVADMVLSTGTTATNIVRGYN